MLKKSLQFVEITERKSKDRKVESKEEKMDIKVDREKFGILCVCAIRYCFGRETYMPSLVQGIVRRYLKQIEDTELHVMIADCDFQEWANLYGDERIDKPGWLKWKEDLLTEQKRRCEK